MVQEGRVDAIRSVSIWKGGKAGLLSPAREFFCFPYGGWEKGEEVVGLVGEFGLSDSSEIRPAG